MVRTPAVVFGFRLEVHPTRGKFSPMRVFRYFTVCLMAAPAFAAQDASPTRFPASRYEKMLEESPFTLATPVVTAEAPKDSFTKDWVLTGISKMRDEHGVERDFVSIMTRDQTQRFALFGNEPNAEGVSIVSIERSPQTGRSKVTLKKGSEYGTVEFDQMLMQQSPAPVAAPGRPVAPGASQVPQRIPGLNPGRQPLSGRPMIPRPNQPTPPGGAQMNSGNGGAPFPSQAQPGNTPRRIRVINSKP